MARLEFDATDRRIITKLDPDFMIDGSNEVASVNGVKVEIVRTDTDKLELTIYFSELEFPILMLRSRTMQELGVKEES